MFLIHEWLGVCWQRANVGRYYECLICVESEIKLACIGSFRGQNNKIFTSRECQAKKIV